MVAKNKKLKKKIEELQSTIKKNKEINEKKDKFCNSTMSALGMQFVQTVDPKKNSNGLTFIQRQSENIYQF